MTILPSFSLISVKISLTWIDQKCASWSQKTTFCFKIASVWEKTTVLSQPGRSKSAQAFVPDCYHVSAAIPGQAIEREAVHVPYVWQNNLSRSARQDC